MLAEPWRKLVPTSHVISYLKSSSNHVLHAAGCGRSALNEGNTNSPGWRQTLSWQAVTESYAVWGPFHIPVSVSPLVSLKVPGSARIAYPFPVRLISVMSPCHLVMMQNSQTALLEYFVVVVDEVLSSRGSDL